MSIGDHSLFWLLLLGAVHGVNPAMGWLFAVALGLQERSARAVWRALLPLAAGHALAIGAAILVAVAIGRVVPAGVLKWAVAVALLALAVRQLRRHRHPRWGGMQVGMRDLAVWSLLMASAHGAGLMVLPLLLPDETPQIAALHAQASDAATHAPHAPHAPVAGDAGADALAGSHAAHAAGADGRLGIVATLVHTLGYLLVTGLMAVAVYYWAGLRLLRAAWINLDLLWASALAITALLTPLL
jgi:hypothetical protein